MTDSQVGERDRETPLRVSWDAGVCVWRGGFKHYKPLPKRF